MRDCLMELKIKIEQLEQQNKVEWLELKKKHLKLFQAVG